jgi:UDP-N-acetyl-2-amino-2-deoxyglucuronate dehydrogenase
LSSDIRFGIIGCGVIAPWHVGAIKSARGARLVAVCDCIEDKACGLASHDDGVKVYQDYHELLSDPEIDAVCICTPSGMHAQMAIDAARAGKHVLSEKPMDVTLASMDAMISECRKSGVKLAIIFQRRTSPVWHKIRDAVAVGKLGKMVLGDAYLKYHRGQEYYDSGEWRGTRALDGGGVLMNQGVHLIDMLLWVMGPVASVFAYADHLVRNIEVEDTAVAALRFQSGALGLIEGTTVANPPMEHRLEFHGELGAIRVEGETIVEWSIPGDDVVSETGSGGVDIKLGTAGSKPTDDAIAGHRAQIEDLCAAIHEDRDPMVTGEEARKAVELILAIYESARTGAAVTMPLKRE